MKFLRNKDIAIIACADTKLVRNGGRSVMALAGDVLGQVLERSGLERSDIDAGKSKVSHPNKRTTYSQALRKLLYQAHLKFEVRYDDAGKPFLWVTTLRPVQ